MHALNVLFRSATIVAALVLGTTARADHHAVKVASKEKVGSYLTDAKGMTLYVFKKDSSGKSACAGECVANWPVYFRESVGVTDGVQASDFAIITRDDGQKQTTYKGMPLYYFARDKAPGDTTGQGARDVWFAAAP